jgi:putative hemolysin
MPSAGNKQNLNLDFNSANPLAALFLTAARRPVERLLSLERIRALYRRVSGPLSAKAFIDGALETLEISREVRPDDLERIPRQGPAVLVSNHPFGVVDPLVILSVVLSIRPDAWVLGNYMLRRIRELRDVLVPVNPFGGSRATRDNLRAVRRCIRLLREGRMLCMFPSGTVSHVHVRPGLPRVTDPPWNPVAARLACKTQAVVVPAYVAGRNSALFQMAGLIHPALRTALLPRETVNKWGGCIHVRIGSPLSPQRLRRLPTDTERIDFLRTRTYLLAENQSLPRKAFPLRALDAPLRPLAPPQPPQELIREVRRLPSDQVLVADDDFLVLQAEAAQIPALLKEIARLRELTFRQEKEGTGAPMDMDRFDLHYRHLILWSRARQQVAGAYRMGLSQEILPAFGPRGFYTQTLFHYSRRFWNRIGPAIELGRSFVRTIYQRNYKPLFLLWKGIAQFVLHNPHYRHLFGPVSITRAYHCRSRHIMAAFLKENNHATHLARLVRARRPLRRNVLKFGEIRNAVDALKDIRELSELISEIEDDRKGVPVLIRQYLRLGGVVLGFNVDQDFRDALDALVLVDLARTDAKTLARYMGSAEVEAFLRIHADPRMAQCA